MKSLFATLVALALACLATQPALARSAAEYLPEDSDLDPAIPTPESVLGWEVGDWHVSHDRLLGYMRVLADASPRVSLKVTGYTYEQRALLLLTVTAPDNANRIEDMRRAHLEGEQGTPLVVWLGYSVHGDEPSGANAALLAAYYLAASRSEFVNELLADSIVLIDPSLNPDGLDRYASWVNSNAGAVPVEDPAARQHHEPWPTGRTNHYWFDLNRDWLPLVHPESRARMAEFQRWRPHVLTDHHEQGGYPGFFFQPGVPTRQNPLTPAENLELTRALASFHAEAMDAAGQPIFMEEAFDDFYYGKGSTYPDINGGIGILFEQKGVTGQVLATSNGVETFQMAVANHLRATLSTLRGAWALRDRLRDYQRNFFPQMLDAAERVGHAGWVVGDDGDPARARAFLDLLDMHEIEYRAISEAVNAGDHGFNSGHAWFIPARQRQFGLLRAIMEQRTEFPDETFYDVSAWTMPMAYNLPFATLRQAPATREPTPSSQGLPPAADAPAWLIPWNQLRASATLQTLLAADVRVRTSLEPFSVRTSNGLTTFEAGTLLIQSGIQDEENLIKAHELLTEAALAGLAVHSAQQTITAAGPDFGSAKYPLVKPVNPLLLGGSGVSSYDAGEAWFTLDQRLGVPTTIVEFERLKDTDLAPYTHFILPDGDYEKIDPAHLQTLRDRALAGAVVIAIGRAAPWVENMCFEKDPALCPQIPGAAGAATTTPAAEPVPAGAAPTPPGGQQEPVEPPPEPKPYGSFEDDVAQNTIGGAIVNSILDATHPLAFGFPRSTLPIMRVETAVLKPSENAYSTPVRYAGQPLLAGFVGNERLAAFAGGPAVIAEKRGNGLVVRFANNPLFRGFWRGSERLFLNALYFGQTVLATELPE